MPAQETFDDMRRAARTGKTTAQDKREKLDAIAAPRGTMRPDSEDKLSPFHLAAFLMERNTARKLGFNAYQIALDSYTLTRLGKRLASYALAMCNTGLNESQERAREKVAAQAQEVAGWYDLTAQCHGDPRGYVLRVDGEGVQRNGMGDGFGIA